MMGRWMGGWTDTQASRQMREEGVPSPTVEYQLINVQGVGEWENHHFATIMLKVRLCRDHQWILNIGQILNTG